MELVFSKNYDIKLGPFSKIHPFDSQKYGRAMQKLRKMLSDKIIDEHLHIPHSAVDSEILAQIHDINYLESLKSSRNIATALEVPIAKYVPKFLLDKIILKSMRYACAGSILAAELAFISPKATAVNMSGGYHHAKPNKAEGFCIYSDIALAVDYLRNSNYLGKEDTIAYIDLDAHLGNGVAHFFIEDKAFKIFDMFNSDIYPKEDYKARERVDFPVDLKSGCKGEPYLGHLKELLPSFLNDIDNAKFAIYNAGNDIYENDPLGRMSVSRAAILERDLFVIRELNKRKIPIMILLSGGYTTTSFEMIADTIYEFLK